MFRSRRDKRPSHRRLRPALYQVRSKAGCLRQEDDDLRLNTAREILMDGNAHEVREVAQIGASRPFDEREYVMTVARTLDGWRPRIVLQRWRDDPGDDVRTIAAEALTHITLHSGRATA